MKNLNRALLLTSAGSLLLLLSACGTVDGGMDGHMMLEDKAPRQAVPESKEGPSESMPDEPEEAGKPPSAMRQDDMPVETPKASMQRGKIQDAKPIPMPVEPK